MELIAETCFPKASLVTDRFHVQHLAIDALQEIRIAHRWEAIDQENEEIELAKELKDQQIHKHIRSRKSSRRNGIISRFDLSHHRTYRSGIRRFFIYDDILR